MKLESIPINRCDLKRPHQMRVRTNQKVIGRPFPHQARRIYAAEDARAAGRIHAPVESAAPVGPANRGTKGIVSQLKSTHYYFLCGVVPMGSTPQSKS